MRAVTATKGHRIFAALYDRLTAPAERRILAEHRAYLAGRARGRVLELGAGTGANFPYFPADVELVAVDPDPHMLRRARRRAKQLGRSIALQQAPAEDLPFPDASFDTVVVTLVLCSVEEPDRALAEVRRVVRPGGELRFLEHVRAPSVGWARFQDAITPVWGWCGAGCHPNRETVSAIERAGFRIVELEHDDRVVYPTRPLARGVAVR